MTGLGRARHHAQMRDIRADAMTNAPRRVEAGGGITLVFPDPDLVVHPGWPWIEHVCKTGEGEDVLNAVSLHPEHEVSEDGLTVSPSILCGCGLHGFLKGGVWRAC